MSATIAVPAPDALFTPSPLKRRRPISAALALLAMAVCLPVSASSWSSHGPGHGDVHGHRGAHSGAYRGVMAYGPQPVRYGHPGHHHGGRHHHGGHGRNIWGPLIVGGLVGAAIVSASQAQAQAQPQVSTLVVPVAPPSHLLPAPAVPPLAGTVWAQPPVYGAAPVAAPYPAIPAPPPPRVHYYCSHYRAYHPQVAECPVPWTLIPY